MVAASVHRTGGGTTLTAAEPGEPTLYAFGSDDRILAFTENQQINVVASNAASGGGDEGTAPAPSELEFQGKRYLSSTFPEGQDVLAHAREHGASACEVDVSEG